MSRPLPQPRGCLSKPKNAPLLVQPASNEEGPGRASEVARAPRIVPPAGGWPRRPGPIGELPKKNATSRNILQTSVERGA